MHAIASLDQKLENYSRAKAHETVAVEYGTAIVWLNGKLEGEMRERIIAGIVDDPAIVDVFFSPAKANLLNIEFRFDLIRYDKLISRIRLLHPDASVVGF